MRSVPRLCEFNPDICLTTEEKHGKTSVIPSGVESATRRLLLKCLHQLHHRGPRTLSVPLVYRYFGVGKSAVPVCSLPLYYISALVIGKSVTLMLLSLLNEQSVYPVISATTLALQLQSSPLYQQTTSTVSSAPSAFRQLRTSTSAPFDLRAARSLAYLVFIVCSSDADADRSVLPSWG